MGPDVAKAARLVLDAAVKAAYSGGKNISWMPVIAGQAAFKKTGEAMPKETLELIKEHKIALKGPLETPVGGGMRSLNVFLRQHFDLYACVRPVKYFNGVAAPVSAPEKLDVIIFRENTEDVYAGIEWEKNSPGALKLISFLKEQGVSVREDSGIGIKPISEFCSKRLVRAAITYALENKRESVTIVHKGNIMKYTEGAFCAWGYEVAKEFGERVITEKKITEELNGIAPQGKLVIKDRIADSMFQQILLRPDEYDVIATTNLNGDYLSDAAAAQVGGLGLAPGANINYETGFGIFEATHGSAPKYANLDKVNPSSLILSGEMMLRHLGWKKAADLVEKAVGETIRQKTVTYDLARAMDGSVEVKCSQFASLCADNAFKIAQE